MVVSAGVHVLHGVPTLATPSYANVILVLVPCVGLSMLSAEEANECDIYVQAEDLQAPSAGNT